MNHADYMLDRAKLKTALFKWRILALFAVFAAIVIYIYSHHGFRPMTEGFVAQIEFNGLILDQAEQVETLKELNKAPLVKAIMVKIDSEGSTAVAGEDIYNHLRKIGQTKPIVVTVGNLAASGGYMIALGGDYIFAHRASLTGSIGVIFQSFEVTELGKKLGVEPVTIKSAELKASPSPFEKMSPKAARATQDLVDDTYKMFISMVKERRKLTPATLAKVIDGRVFTGNQALALGLIDAIGDEHDALNWLITQKNLPKDIQVLPVTLKKPPHFFSSLSNSLSPFANFFTKDNKFTGLMLTY